MKSAEEWEVVYGNRPHGGTGGKAVHAGNLYDPWCSECLKNTIRDAQADALKEAAKIADKCLSSDGARERICDLVNKIEYPE